MCQTKSRDGSSTTLFQRPEREQGACSTSQALKWVCFEGGIQTYLSSEIADNIVWKNGIKKAEKREKKVFGSSVGTCMSRKRCAIVN